MQTDTFEVVLEAEPDSNVVFNVASADVLEATISPATLTFTPANWSVSQTVSVTSVQDDELGDDTLPLSALAIGWNLNCHKQCIPIAGAKNVRQVEENARGLECELPSWALERLEMVSAPAPRLDKAS